MIADDARVEAGWRAALAPASGDLERARAFLADEIADGRGYLPPDDLVLRAFETPFDRVRVLIVGQDPYPTPGHSVGLPFSVDPELRPLPRSLVNIHRELRDDLGIATPEHGDLSAWTGAGVMLVNRVLTVRPGQPGSHRRRGWEAVTARGIQALAERGTPLVAILWGKDAATIRPLLGDVPAIESAHPSPLSAARGFFGSRPFSRANELLAAQGASPVDWSIPR